MKIILAQLPIILVYLNEESGNEKVKERLESFYGWLGYKISRTTDLDQLKKLQAEPNDPQVQEQWRLIIEEAVAEDDLFYEELNVRLNEGVELIQEKDPDWYQSYISNHSDPKIESSGREF